MLLPNARLGLRSRRRLFIKELRLAAARGAAVVVVSIDLDEILELASRLIVIQGGRITGEVAANQVTAAELGVMLGGGIAA